MITAKKLFARTQQHMLRAIDYNRNDLIRNGYDANSCTNFVNMTMLGAVAASECAMLGQNKRESCEELVKRLATIVQDWRKAHEMQDRIPSEQPKETGSRHGGQSADVPQQGSGQAILA